MVHFWITFVSALWLVYFRFSCFVLCAGAFGKNFLKLGQASVKDYENRIY